jgi:cytochrome P450
MLQPRRASPPPHPNLGPSQGKPLSKEQLLPEIGAFILAGFDTSSHTIAWCL